MLTHFSYNTLFYSSIRDSLTTVRIVTGRGNWWDVMRHNGQIQTIEAGTTQSAGVAADQLYRPLLVPAGVDMTIANPAPARSSRWLSGSRLIERNARCQRWCSRFQAIPWPTSSNTITSLYSDSSRPVSSLSDR